MKRKDFAIAVLPLWCFFALSLFSACSDENVAKAKPNVVVPVVVGTVQQKAIPVQLRAIGNAQALSTVTVKALVGGELIKVHFGKTGPWNRPKHPAAEDIPPEEFITREVDPILDKISAHGIQSLTPHERKILEEARAKMGKR